MKRKSHRREGEVSHHEWKKEPCRLHCWMENNPRNRPGRKMTERICGSLWTSCTAQQGGNSNPRVSVSAMCVYPFLPGVRRSFCVRITQNSTWQRSGVRMDSLLFTTVDMRRGFSVSRKGYEVMRSPRCKRGALRCPIWMEKRIPCPTIGARKSCSSPGPRGEAVVLTCQSGRAFAKNSKPRIL